MGRLPGSDATGGSRQLLQLIDEHGTAILADLRRYFGVDLRDLWRDGGDLTPRYVFWLVEHLPADSSTWAAMKGGKEHRSWTTETYLLAHAVNALVVGNHQRAGKRIRKMPVVPPKPKIKPTMVKKKTGRVVRVADMNARRALMKQINEGR